MPHDTVDEGRPNQSLASASSAAAAGKDRSSCRIDWRLMPSSAAVAPKETTVSSDHAGTWPTRHAPTPPSLHDCQFVLARTRRFESARELLSKRARDYALEEATNNQPTGSCNPCSASGGQPPATEAKSGWRMAAGICSCASRVNTSCVGTTRMSRPPLNWQTCATACLSGPPCATRTRLVAQSRWPRELHAPRASGTGKRGPTWWVRERLMARAECPAPGRCQLGCSSRREVIKTPRMPLHSEILDLSKVS